MGTVGSVLQVRGTKSSRDFISLEMLRSNFHSQRGGMVSMRPDITAV